MWYVDQCMRTALALLALSACSGGGIATPHACEWSLSSPISMRGGTDQTDSNTQGREFCIFHDVHFDVRDAEGFRIAGQVRALGEPTTLDSGIAGELLDYSEPGSAPMDAPTCDLWSGTQLLTVDAMRFHLQIDARCSTADFRLVASIDGVAH